MPTEAGEGDVGGTMGEPESEPKQPTGGRCPICGKPAVHAVRPFCSSRCADIDLGRWMSGSYLVAGGDSDADDDGDDAAAAKAGRADLHAPPETDE